MQALNIWIDATQFFTMNLLKLLKLSNTLSIWTIQSFLHNFRPKSKRTLLVSFRKGLLLSRQIILVLDCEFVTVSDSCSNLDISSFLPSNIRNRQTWTVDILDFDEPLKMFALSEMDDFSLKGFFFFLFWSSLPQYWGFCKFKDCGFYLFTE